MTITEYTDFLGSVVQVGTIVGYVEESDNSDKSYRITEFQTWPDMGDIAVMSEVTEIDGIWVDTPSFTDKYAKITEIAAI